MHIRHFLRGSIMAAALFAASAAFASTQTMSATNGSPCTASDYSSISSYWNFGYGTVENVNGSARWWQVGIPVSSTVGSVTIDAYVIGTGFLGSSYAKVVSVSSSGAWSAETSTQNTGSTSTVQDLTFSSITPPSGGTLILQAQLAAWNVNSGGKLSQVKWTL